MRMLRYPGARRRAPGQTADSYPTARPPAWPPAILRLSTLVSPPPLLVLRRRRNDRENRRDVPLGNLAGLDSRDFLARLHIDHRDGVVVRVGDVDLLPVRREREPIGNQPDFHFAEVLEIRHRIHVHSAVELARRP